MKLWRVHCKPWKPKMVTIHLQSKSSSNPSKPASFNRCSFYFEGEHFLFTCTNVCVCVYIYIYMELESRTKLVGETWALCPTVLITKWFSPVWLQCAHTMPAHSDPLHREQEYFASSTVSLEWENPLFTLVSAWSTSRHCTMRPGWTVSREVLLKCEHSVSKLWVL